MSFLDESAGSSTWRAILEGAEPAPAGDQIGGPWGDAIRAATQAEIAGRGGDFDDMPVGQVINFLGERGFGDWVKAAEATEQAARQGGPQTIGMPAPGAPPQQKMDDGPKTPAQELEEITMNTNFLLVHQKMNLLEAITQGCCEMSNQYKIMNERNEHVASAFEDSPGFARCCCAPYHSTKVYVKKAGVAKEDNAEAFLTIERPGLGCPPKKCIGNSCPTCPMDCCKDGITLYEGFVEGDVGDLQNAPEPMVMVKEATCGGGLWPKLMVHPKGDDKLEPTHYIQGPFIFGGCSELCMTATWNYKTTGDKQLGTIVHETPKSCGDVCAEVCTDVDKFKIEYTQEASGQDRATVLASAFLVDYMFFEMDNGMLSCKGGTRCEITLCFCNCCGMQVPCKCVCQKGEGGGEGGDDGGTE